MDVFKAVKERRSVRSFLPREIPSETLDRLAEALMWAPSAGNLQSRRFFFIRDADLKRRLASAALGQGFISEAPVVVVGCADAGISRHYGRRGVDLYMIQDVSASIMAMMLVATEAGLGTCWVGAFREEEVSALLRLPANLRPVAVIPMGYPARVPRPPARRPASEAVEFR